MISDEIKNWFQFRDDLWTDKEKSTVPIELLTPPGKGVIIRFTSIRIDEDKDGLGATMNFGYDIINSNGYNKRTLKKTPNFEKNLGLILNYLILTKMEIDVGIKNDGTANTEKFDQE